MVTQGRGRRRRRIVDRAQAEISTTSPSAAPPRTSVPLEQLLQPTMDEIDAIASQGAGSRRVPTGFTELDELTQGLHPGQMVVTRRGPVAGQGPGPWTHRFRRRRAGPPWAR